MVLLWDDVIRGYLDSLLGVECIKSTSSGICSLQKKNKPTECCVPSMTCSLYCGLICGRCKREAVYAHQSEVHVKYK